MRAWRKIDRRVPIGISFLPAGTMTVNVDLPALRYLAWLPVWPTNLKPCFSRAFTISLDEYGLGTDEREFNYLCALDRCGFFGFVISEIEFQGIG